jgi:hypothetical protein
MLNKISIVFGDKYMYGHGIYHELSLYLSKEDLEKFEYMIKDLKYRYGIDLQEEFCEYDSTNLSPELSKLLLDNNVVIECGDGKVCIHNSEEGIVKTDSILSIFGTYAYFDIILGIASLLYGIKYTKDTPSIKEFELGGYGLLGV